MRAFINIFEKYLESEVILLQYGEKYDKIHIYKFPVLRCAVRPVADDGSGARTFGTISRPWWGSTSGLGGVISVCTMELFYI